MIKLIKNYFRKKEMSQIYYWKRVFLNERNSDKKELEALRKKVLKNICPFKNKECNGLDFGCQFYSHGYLSSGNFRGFFRNLEGNYSSIYKPYFVKPKCLLCREG